MTPMTPSDCSIWRRTPTTPSYYSSRSRTITVRYVLVEDDDRTLFFGKAKDIESPPPKPRSEASKSKSLSATETSKMPGSAQEQAATDEGESISLPPPGTAEKDNKISPLEFSAETADDRETPFFAREQKELSAPKAKTPQMPKTPLPPKQAATERGTTIRLVQEKVEETVEVIKAVPTVVEEEVEKAFSSIEAELQKSKKQIESKVDEIEKGIESKVVEFEKGIESTIVEIEQEIDKTKREIDEKVDEVKAIPVRVEKRIDETKAEVERKRREIVETVDEIKAIPSKVQTSVEETKAKVDNTVATIDRTAKEIEAVPGKLKTGFFETKDKFYDTLDAIAEIPGKVEKTVIETKAKVDDTVTAVQSIPGNVKKGIDAVTDTANALKDLATGLAKGKPKVMKEGQSAKTDSAVTKDDGDIGDEVTDALRLADIAIKGADDVLKESVSMKK